ncbi:MAG: carbohydrate ABC transporter permease [Peptoniphilaceae bacterium]
MERVEENLKGQSLTKKKSIKINRVWKYVRLLLNICLSIVVLFPLIYAISMSLKPASEIYVDNPSLFTANPTIQNYIEVFKLAPIEGYILNSFIVSIIIMLSQIGTAIIAAFAFHFLNFKFKGTLFALIMSTMMIPTETTIISNFLMISGWGLSNSYIGLVLPYLTSAMGIFLFKQSFKSFPMEIYESSKIDGCSNLRFVLTILIPISKPVIGALSVSAFLGAWNMYMWPLLMTGSDSYRTVQIGISMLNSVDSQSMVLMIAGVVVCMIPSLIIFLFAQKNMIRGLTQGAVKG